MIERYGTNDCVAVKHGEIVSAVEKHSLDVVMLGSARHVVVLRRIERGRGSGE